VQQQSKGVDLRLPPSMRKKEPSLPPSLRKSSENLRTNEGGGPPPGYGVHEDEQHLWQEPRYAKHPVTNRLEAVDSGLFFKMWPEHVEKIMKMKEIGYAHVEIVRVSRDLWDIQKKAAKDDQALVDQHKEAQQQAQVAQVHDARHGELNPINPPPNALPGQMEHQLPAPAAPGPMPPQMPQPQGPPGQPLARALSMRSDDDYQAALMKFQGESYNRDPSGPGMMRQGSIMRSMQQRNKPKGRSKMTIPKREVTMSSDKNNGFTILVKADTTGGERALTPEQARRKKEMTFTRKEVGVANAPFNPPPEEPNMPVVPKGSNSF